MTGSIPAIAGVMMVAAAARRTRRADPAGPWFREAAMVGAIVWTLVVAASTEALSLFAALSFWPVLGIWVAALCGAGWCVFRPLTPGAPTAAAIAVPPGEGASTPPVEPGAAGERGGWRHYALRDAVVASSISFASVIVALCAVSAAAAPPNNYDALAYHMPRQVKWIAQGSVAHFQTLEIRQLIMPPLAEFMGAHFMILSNGDAYANLLQTVGLGLSAVAASLVALQLGAGAPGQCVAALFAATIPAAVHEAASPKNDIIAGLWGLVFVWSCLKIIRSRGGGGAVWRNVPRAGLSLGFFLLTKGTAAVFAAPLIAAVGPVMVARERWRGVVAGLAIGVIAVVVNVPHLARNWSAYGRLSGPSVEEGGYALTLETHSARALVSTLLRNLALHAWTPIPGSAEAINAIVRGLHSEMGADPDDPRTTFNYCPKFTPAQPVTDENHAAAPLHLLVVLACPFVLVLGAGPRGTGLLTAGYGVAVLASLVVFCAVFKWQEWHPRLHIPWMLLMAPVAGVVLGRGVGAGVGLLWGLGATALAVWAVLGSMTRPWFGPESIFTGDSLQTMLIREAPQFREALASTVAGAGGIAPKRVAIALRSNDLEYAVQRPVVRLPTRPRIVVTPFGRSAGAEPDVDAIITVDSLRENRAYVPASYESAARFPPFVLCMPRRRVGEAP